MADPGGCRGRGRDLAVASVLYAGLLLLLLLCRKEENRRGRVCVSNNCLQH